MIHGTKLIANDLICKRRGMKFFIANTALLFMMVTLCLNQIKAQDASNLNPENYFDFWVGHWEVSWEESDGIMGKGTNRVRKKLDGTVIEENFEITEGQNKGLKGTSISVYQRQLKVWKQAWADNQGGFYDFTGRLEGDKRIFQTRVFELEDGREFTQRMVFYDIKEDSVMWDWESSQDGGETWRLNWRIRYQRMDE